MQSFWTSKKLIGMLVVSSVITIAFFQNCAQHSDDFASKAPNSVCAEGGDDCLKLAKAIAIKNTSTVYVPLCPGIGSNKSISMTVEYSTFNEGGLKEECVDNTDLGPGLAAYVGKPLCTSGPSLKPIWPSATAGLTNTTKQDCSNVSICGVLPTAHDFIDDPSHPGSRIYMLQYNNLPLGCSGKLQVFGADGNEVVPKSYEISIPGIKEKICRLQSGSLYTCSLAQDGACGADHGRSNLTAAPTQMCASSDMKASQKLPFLDLKTFTYSWECFGVSGGKKSPICQAKLGSVNGECGEDNGKTLLMSPTKLCRLSTMRMTRAIPFLNKTTNKYSWTCSGVNGGATSQECTATQFTSYVKCGTSHGGTFDSTPQENLCVNGKPGQINLSYNGLKFNWVCSGEYNTTAVCNANHSIKASCGSANGGDFAVVPTQGLCSPAGVTNTAVMRKGKVDNIEGGQTYAWTCKSANMKETSDCMAYVQINGKCNARAVKLSSTTVAASTLCTFGNPTEVKFDPTTSKFTWTCRGWHGSDSPLCTAVKK